MRYNHAFNFHRIDFGQKLYVKTVSFDEVSGETLEANAVVVPKSEYKEDPTKDGVVALLACREKLNNNKNILFINFKHKQCKNLIRRLVCFNNGRCWLFLHLSLKIGLHGVRDAIISPKEIYRITAFTFIQCRYTFVALILIQIGFLEMITYFDELNFKHEMEVGFEIFLCECIINF